MSGGRRPCPVTAGQAQKLLTTFTNASSILAGPVASNALPDDALAIRSSVVRSDSRSKAMQKILTGRSGSSATSASSRAEPDLLADQAAERGARAGEVPEARGGARPVGRRGGHRAGAAPARVPGRRALRRELDVRAR